MPESGPQPVQGVEISLSFFRTVDNSVPQAKHAAMRRAWVVAVMVVAAVLVWAYGPKNSYITWTSGNVAREIAPLNVVLFWLLVVAALVVLAFTALRRRARS